MQTILADAERDYAELRFGNFFQTVHDPLRLLLLFMCPKVQHRDM